jgi:hypothetical protein
MSTDRLNEMFRLLDQGMTADKIQQVLREKNIRDREEFGHPAEQMVADAINHLPFVLEAVVGTDSDDREGDDVIVRFFPETRHNDVTIQIKQSWTGVHRFVERKQNADRPRRIIMKVGPDYSDARINSIFLSKLKKLDGFIVANKH